MDSKAVEELPITDRFWAWFETNKRQAGWGLVAVLVLGVVLGFYFWNKSQQQIAAGEAVTVVSWTMGGPSGTLRPGGVEAFLKVANEYRNSSAGERALMQAAANLFTEGKYDQAKSQFEKFAREYSESSLIGRARLGVAASLDAQNKTTEAIAAYKDLVEHHPADAAVPQAKFALARLYEAQNKPELARPLYEDVGRNEPNSSLGSEAGMRLEELKQKFPALFTPPPPPPSPISILGTNAPGTNAAVPAPKIQTNK